VAAQVYYSGNGINAAFDGWGTRLRQKHNTTKQEDEDVFLQTLSLWTDNGAATLGVAWHSDGPPPEHTGPGSYVALNWSMVDQQHMVEVAAQVSGTGIAPRGIQYDW
jgi:hypothetical protein